MWPWCSESKQFNEIEDFVSNLWRTGPVQEGALKHAAQTAGATEP